MIICKLWRLEQEHIEEIAEQDTALRDLLVDGTEVAVLSVEVDNRTGDLSDNYYNVIFADGTACAALSGYHLHGIAHWK